MYRSVYLEFGVRGLMFQHLAFASGFGLMLSTSGLQRLDRYGQHRGCTLGDSPLQ